MFASPFLEIQRTVNKLDRALASPALAFLHGYVVYWMHDAAPLARLDLALRQVSLVACIAVPVLARDVVCILCKQLWVEDAVLVCKAAATLA